MIKMRLFVVALAIAFLLAGCGEKQSSSASKLPEVPVQKAEVLEDPVKTKCGLANPVVDQPEGKPEDEPEDFFDFDADG